MKRKVVSGIMLTLLLISMLTLAFNVQPVKASGTIYIRPNGSIDPPTANITSVDNVTYTFTVNINDSIVVERSNIIIDGARYTVQGNGSGYGFSLYCVNNVTIKNTNIIGFSWGVCLAFSFNNTISGNNITNNTKHGVLFDWYSSYNTISGNNITNNDWGVLLFWGSSYNTLSENTVTNNNYGIHLCYSCNNVFKNNSMVGNLHNFGVGGSALSDFIQDMDVSNTVDGKPVYYWVNRQNEKIPSDAGYVALVNSTNINVKGLELENNYQGILLASTTNSQITNNTITKNSYGVDLWNSSNNALPRNNITENGCGVKLYWDSSNNKIYHNNFINNTDQVRLYESYNNVWDDGYPSGGNYWSDHLGVDIYSGPYQNETGSDGIVDTPYVIDYRNRDRYPFMNPLLFEHELAVSMEAPAFLKPGDPSSLRATIHNLGSSNETNVELQLLINGTIVNSTTISELVSGASHTLSYLWIPMVEGIYNVTTHAPLVPGETLTYNNWDTKFTIVRFPPVHNLNTGLNYQTIQGAIDAPETLGGHAILVDAGTYYEHVVVNKSLTLLGENRETTIIDGSWTGTVVNVTANDVFINGFTIQNSGTGWLNCGIYLSGSTDARIHYNNLTNNQVGIWLSYSSDNYLVDNNIANNEYGVLLLYSSNNTLSGNTVYSNKWDGIWLGYSYCNILTGNNVSSNSYGIGLGYSSNNTVDGSNIYLNSEVGIRLEASGGNTLRNNNIVGSEVGIRLEASGGNTLRNNNIVGSEVGFDVDGDILSHFIQDVDTSNTVAGMPISYLINESNLIIENSGIGQLILVNSTGITVRNLSFTKKGQSVLLAYTNHSLIENMKFSNLWSYGIEIYYSEGNQIEQNIFQNQARGVFLSHSDNNVLNGNIFSDGGVGISMEWGCSNNTIVGNTLSNYSACIAVFGDPYYPSDNNTVINNILNGSEHGVSLFHSHKNLISGNTISNNRHGLYISSSNDNRIFHNNFIDNEYQTFSWNSINVWDDGYPSGGNYWSDQYHGDCADHFSGPGQDIPGSDGIVDTLYPIEVDNQDNYPLMEPWTPLPRTIGELKTQIEELGSEGEIDNQGIVKSLIAKLNVAQKLIDKGRIDEAKSILEDDFILQVQNLSGILITVEAADILIQSAEYILSQL